MTEKLSPRQREAIDAPYLCAWTRDDRECDEPATFSLRFRANKTGFSIEACDEHLAALAHGVTLLYEPYAVQIVELKEETP